MSTSFVLTSKQREQRRMQAAALFGQRLSNAEIARRLGVSRQTVSGWHTRWQSQGETSLRARKPGPNARLNDAQRQQIGAALLDTADAHGFATPLWTLERVAVLIERLTFVRYTPGHVWYVLRDLGFTCQKPTCRARERDEAAIAAWVKEEWPRIKKGR